MNTDPKQFRPYLSAPGLTLIPLRHWREFAEGEDGSVIPLGKMPRAGGWTTATFDSEAVYRDAVRDGHNLGCRLSDEWLVIDYDVRRDPEGEEWQAFQADAWLELFPVVETGGGGRHVYMRRPPGLVLTLAESYPGMPSIEIKSTARRQVVAAGSVHPSGALYRWLPGHPALKDAPAAPAALLGVITRKRAPRRLVKRGETVTGETLAALLAGLDPADHSDRRSWFTLGAACHNASDGDDAARDAWSAWCAGDPKYDNGQSNSECVALWSSLSRQSTNNSEKKKAGIRTIYFHLKNAGREDLIPKVQHGRRRQRDEFLI